MNFTQCTIPTITINGESYVNNPVNLRLVQSIGLHTGSMHGFLIDFNFKGNRESWIYKDADSRLDDYHMLLAL